eukprot:TRINITY_DN12173_c0_g1_i2.p1 TRINITY_DN12173_c0_g1~~TRINITY_DN12173_c0_g1_i2.p1  ORF type:complete len:306 (-),score=-18.58 TRINITY_DN12173_c0_g1_i2:509-1426(-)
MLEMSHRFGNLTYQTQVLVLFFKFFVVFAARMKNVSLEKYYAIKKVCNLHLLYSCQKYNNLLELCIYILYFLTRYNQQRYNIFISGQNPPFFSCMRVCSFVITGQAGIVLVFILILLILNEFVTIGPIVFSLSCQKFYQTRSLHDVEFFIFKYRSDTRQGRGMGHNIYISVELLYRLQNCSYHFIEVQLLYGILNLDVIITSKFITYYVKQFLNYEWNFNQKYTTQEDYSILLQSLYIQNELVKEVITSKKSFFHPLKFIHCIFCFLSYQYNSSDNFYYKNCTRYILTIKFNIFDEIFLLKFIPS